MQENAASAGISMRRARSLAGVQARALHVSRARSVALATLKPHDDESEDSNDDSVFDAFA